MDGYRHFSVASYMFAYYAAKATDEQIRRDMETYQRYLPLRKVYLENHRAQTDIPVQRLREIKAILEEYGVQVSGGITPPCWWTGSRNRPCLIPSATPIRGTAGNT